MNVIYFCCSTVYVFIGFIIDRLCVCVNVLCYVMSKVLQFPDLIYLFILLFVYEERCPFPPKLVSVNINDGSVLVFMFMIYVYFPVALWVV